MRALRRMRTAVLAPEFIRSSFGRVSRRTASILATWFVFIHPPPRIKPRTRVRPLLPCGFVFPIPLDAGQNFLRARFQPRFRVTLLRQEARNLSRIPRPEVLEVRHRAFTNTRRHRAVFE